MHRRFQSNLSDTDTCDTAEDCTLGGLEKYSHGVYNLVHQHWSRQAESHGGFNVHDTEGAEAHHKSCMVLPAKRVRHFNYNKTCEGMQKYLLEHTLFNAVKTQLHVGATVKRRGVVSAVRVPLRRLVGGRIFDVSMGTNLHTVGMQQTIIHDEVRIARCELLDLLCAKLEIPFTQASYVKLEGLEWKFGQKLIRPDGEIFWATDSQYSFFTSNNSRRRRDNFLLHGHEKVEVTLPNGHREQRNTALCCQAICFIKLQNIIDVFSEDTLPTDIREEIHKDQDGSLTLMLVRWFEAHPTAIERNERHMPLCPGPFGINHCLWRYARTHSERKVLIDNGRPTNCFNEQKFLFGKTPRQQFKCLEDEAYAYYDLALPSSVVEMVHMCPEYESDTVVRSSTWLQTITLPTI